jgi:hypothetical protein
MIAVLIFAGLLFAYLLLYRMEIVGIMFFTLTIADINVEIPGIPMKVRALLGIILFIRILFEAKNPKYPPFLGFKPGFLLILFIGYFFLVSWGRDSLTMEISKVLLLTVISAYCAYFFYTRYNDYSIIKISIIISALICFADLAFTYVVIGNFPVVRIIDVYLGGGNEQNVESLRYNHNFYGLICGIGYAVVLNDYLHQKGSFKFEYLLLPVFLLGILMSTSRSAILGLIVVTLVLIYFALKNHDTAKRGYRILSIGGISIFLVITGFFAAQSLLNLDAKFLEEITFRLIEEPIAVLRKNLGYSYNIYDLDALDWRGESAEIAFNVFLDLPPFQQIVGVGYGGYLQNNMGRNNLNPHNGFLLLLIEGGLAGLILYVYMVGGEMWKSILNFRFSSSLLALVFMILYCLGQNEELTSAVTFLFVITMASETYGQQSSSEYEPETRLIRLAE